jgi:RNA polymerase sigma factor (TIGR02999 family)
MSGDLTQLLADVRSGGRGALDALFPLVYQSLRDAASRLLRNEDRGHSLKTTDLVHEAYLRLVHRDKVSWHDRAKIVAVAAKAMRRIVVDHARHGRRAKRGGKRVRISLDAACFAVYERDGSPDPIALDEALEQLNAVDSRAAQVVEMRFFAGMTVEEIAAALDVSVSTIERDWRYARAWLFEALGDGVVGKRRAASS